MPLVQPGWDIGPTSPMGPSPSPSWNNRSHGHLYEGRPLYIHRSALPFQEKLQRIIFVQLIGSKQGHADDIVFDETPFHGLGAVLMTKMQAQHDSVPPT